ncbi:MAG: LSm family protein [Chitinophagaceae bacterium]
MANEEITQRVTTLLEKLLEPDPSLFLVELRISPGHQVLIYLDGDQGVSIDQLTGLNRALYRELEGSGIFPENDFSLEVSSADLDQPLKLDRQYQKNLGRKVEVLLTDGIKKEGTLKAADHQQLTLEEISGPRKPSSLMQIPFSQIKHTKVCVVF